MLPEKEAKLRTGHSSTDDPNPWHGASFQEGRSYSVQTSAPGEGFSRLRNYYC